MLDRGSMAFGSGMLSTLFVLVTLILVVLPSLAIPVQTTTTTTTNTSPTSVETPIALPIHIDRALFMATVPSYAKIGGNYTVKVRVVNDWTQPVPIVLRVDAPVDSISVHPLVIHTVVGAGHNLIANFSLVPFSQPASERINVTAVLAVWFFQTMNRPQVVDQVSTLVQSVSPYPYVVEIVVSVAAAATIAAIVLLFLFSSRRKRPEAPFDRL